MLSRLMTRKEQLVLLSFAGAIVVGAAVMWYRAAASGETLNSASPFTATAAVQVKPLAVGAPAPATPPVPEPAPISPPVPAPAPPPPAPEPEPPHTPDPPAMVGVSAAGEVMRPEVYMLPDGARVRDLLQKAGGATPLADLSDINLAARLIDGSTLTIPARRRPGVKTVPAILINPPHYTVSGWQPAPDAKEDPAAAVAPADAVPAATPLAAQPTPLIDLNSASQEELETLPGIGPKLAGEIIAYRSRLPFAAVDDLTNVSGIGEKKLEGFRALVTVR